MLLLRSHLLSNSQLMYNPSHLERRVHKKSPPSTSSLLMQSILCGLNFKDSDFFLHLNDISSYSLTIVNLQGNDSFRMQRENLRACMLLRGAVTYIHGLACVLLPLSFSQSLFNRGAERKGRMWDTKLISLE